MIQRVNVLRFYTTPKELRELADKMEREWPLKKIGMSNEIHRYIKVTDGTMEELRIHVNQDKIND